MSDNINGLDEQENLESMSENTTFETKPTLGEKISNFFNKFTQKRLGPGNNRIQYTNKSFDSWERSAAISDFFSTVGEKAQKVFAPVTNAITGLANKIKESAEAKKYNDPTKDGISVSTIETRSNQPTNVIMPSAPGKIPNTIVMAQATVQSLTNDDVSDATASASPRPATAKSNDAPETIIGKVNPAPANSLVVEDIEVDEVDLVRDEEPIQDAPEPTPQPNSVSIGTIGVEQTTSDKNKDDDFEK